MYDGRDLLISVVSELFHDLTINLISQNLLQKQTCITFRVWQDETENTLQNYKKNQ